MSSSLTAPRPDQPTPSLYDLILRIRSSFTQTSTDLATATTDNVCYTAMQLRLWSPTLSNVPIKTALYDLRTGAVTDGDVWKDARRHTAVPDEPVIFAGVGFSGASLQGAKFTNSLLLATNFSSPFVAAADFIATRGRRMQGMSFNDPCVVFASFRGTNMTRGDSGLPPASPTPSARSRLHGCNPGRGTADEREAGLEARIDYRDPHHRRSTGK